MSKQPQLTMAGSIYRFKIIALFGVLLVYRCQGYVGESVTTTEAPATIDCPAKVKSNNSNHCECLSTLEIRCTNLDYLPVFTESDNVFGGIYMENQDIPEIPAYVFHYLKVQKIVLDYNPIKNNIRRRAFAFNEPHLVELSLGGCGIEDLPDNMLKGLDGLRYLNLWRNKITNIPKNFFKAKKLQEINLWGNGIESLDNGAFTGLRELRKLDLDSNNITRLNKDSFQDLVNLKALHLGQNKINTVYADTFAHLTNLHILNLDGNNMKFIYAGALNNLTKLQSFGLQNNMVNYIPSLFTQQRNLTILHLQNNKVQTIWPTTFEGLVSLQTLDLSNNLLSKFLDRIFEPLTSLKQIYLDRNPIRHLQKCAFSQSANLRTLSMVTTSINCSCGASWIKDLSERGTTVWGSCAAHPFGNGTISVADPKLYGTCAEDKKVCGRGV